MIKILLIIYIIYKLLDLALIGRVIKVILPFILAFVLAYLFNPLLNKLKLYIPKKLSILLIILMIIVIFIFLLSFITPLLIKEVTNIFILIISFMNIISTKYHINLDSFINELYKILNYKYILNGITISISYITNIILTIISFIYFLNEMENIICFIKKISNDKLYNCLSSINKNLKNYFLSLIKISIISFFEYSFFFFIIGHSNPIIVGIIASITNLIPYIGSILVLIIAILLNPSIIIKISILYLILSFIDSYLINPYIYDKYNSIHPLIGLISLSIFGYLFGIIGIIFSIPLTIIIMTIIKYYSKDLINLIKSVNIKFN